MSELLIQMAQRASHDGGLCAQWIGEYSERHNLTWDEIATLFNINRHDLAKLALCRQPSQSKFVQETSQIAEYLGVDNTSITKLFQSLNGFHTAQAASRRPTLLRSDVFNRISWAIAIIPIVLIFSAFIDFRAVPSAATLVVTSGQVSVQDAGNQEQIVAVGRAVTVSAGDSIQLAPGAAAHLRLRGGSTVELAEGASVEVQELVTDRDAYRVQIGLLAGKAVSRVKHLLGAGDKFKIITPSSTVSVRGTVFTVVVLGQESTFVSCEEGVVTVAFGSQEVEVSAGQELTVTLGVPTLVKPQSGVVPTAVPPSPSTQAPLPSASTPVPPTSAVPPPPPTPGVPGATPVPPSYSPPSSGVGSSPVPPGVSPAPPLNLPNSPSQVPGKPPSVVPGSGNPPAGGSEPPGQGGEPPGQTKDKDKGGKDKLPKP